MALQFSDLSFVLDLAKAAPLQRAGDSHMVSDVFKRIEAVIQDGIQQQAVQAALEKAAKQVADTKPQAPAAPQAEPAAKPVAG